MREECGRKLTAANDPPILTKQILNREGAKKRSLWRWRQSSPTLGLLRFLGIWAHDPSTLRDP